MAQWHGQVARHSFMVQGKNNIELIGNWLSDYTTLMGSSSISDSMDNQGISKPRWVSDIPVGTNIISVEQHRNWSRYPGRRHNTYNYTIDHDFGGQVKDIAVIAAIANVNRKSHKGLDQGATRGRNYFDVTVYDTSGNVMLNTSRFRTHRWSGWNSWWRPTWRTYSFSQPVGRVVAKQRLYTGDEAWHDVGDGSPGGGWNPSNVKAPGFYEVPIFQVEPMRRTGTSPVINRVETYQSY